MRRAVVVWISLCAAVLGFPLAVAAGMPAGSGSSAGAARPVALAAAVTSVGMNGTILDPQDLSFLPASVTVAVGDTVSFTNHAIVPHTATEDHRLWNLAGDFGGTPINPPGVAPLASVSRVFEAGTFHYFCQVHPKQMHGVIAVPVTLSVSKRVIRKRRHRRTVYTVHVIWDTTAPPSGEVFDIQRALGGGPFRRWLTGASFAGASFRAGARGSTWHVQARLREAADSSQASDWSPDAVIVAR